MPPKKTDETTKVKKQNKTKQALLERLPVKRMERWELNGEIDIYRQLREAIGDEPVFELVKKRFIETIRREFELVESETPTSSTPETNSECP